MTLEIITGSIFDSKEKYLVHQTNCITNKSAHLSKEVFRNYPYADIYTNRQSPDKPGTIIVKGNGQDQRFVINLLGQYYPGEPKYPDAPLDGSKAREKYFHRGLFEISKIKDLESTAFPFQIGCGAAGGSWPNYYKMIENFSKYLDTIKETKVVIYKLPEN